MPLAVLGHFAGGSVALFAGAFQVNAALRARFLQIHRGQAIAWACWVPNLLVVEWWLLRPVRAKAAYVTV